MPINTYRSGIQVTTNVGGEQVDNDEYISQKNNWEHHHHPTEAWQKGYQAEVNEELVKDILQPQPLEEVEVDASISHSNYKDLLIRGIKTMYSESNQQQQ